ncbi:hypothetical protein [Tessaracoccus antarcticus]|uniref:Uncharacterized protein n=1 Tax=Tessaracoccus antarcticus TaxID=2479848 RepID=A0A3M0GDK4_9ACTN|nr:hypothetical protein [Tessaracoccus antarcticus]RMB59673.1 hypothetical protein EAX62_07875 [Tessaracoccus antarcticus]
MVRNEFSWLAAWGAQRFGLVHTGVGQHRVGAIGWLPRIQRWVATVAGPWGRVLAPGAPRTTPLSYTLQAITAGQPTSPIRGGIETSQSRGFTDGSSVTGIG